MSESDKDNAGMTKPKPVEWLRDTDAGGDKRTEG